MSYVPSAMQAACRSQKCLDLYMFVYQTLPPLNKVLKLEGLLVALGSPATDAGPDKRSRADSPAHAAAGMFLQPSRLGTSLNRLYNTNVTRTVGADPALAA